MMKNKKILIINQSQFGYHTDSYYICKYLKDIYNIKYLCWDYDKPYLIMNGVTVAYISRNGNVAIRNLRFILGALSEIKKQQYDIHFIKYFRGCSILKILNPSKKFIFDIRTGSINKNKINRFVYDNFMKTEAQFFKYISVISKSLAKKLSLFKKVYILPLGADIISDTNKTFQSINLLYVGTLNNRNIDQTIKGFSKFYHEFKDKISISYTIIGSGYNHEENYLKKLVMAESVSDAVILTGQIPHNKLKSYLDNCNIGVSYIPKTDYFDSQPPTKTFEYLLSGMPVIGTDTSENKAVINYTNGVLINDTSESFFRGLKKIYTNKYNYNSHSIRINSMAYTWETIVSNFKNYLSTLIFL